MLSSTQPAIIVRQWFSYIHLGSWLIIITYSPGLDVKIVMEDAEEAYGDDILGEIRGLLPEIRTSNKFEKGVHYKP